MTVIATNTENPSYDAIIYTDGSVNPHGTATIAYIIEDEDQNIIEQSKLQIGPSVTSVEAEYKALVQALEKAVNLGFSNIKAKVDYNGIVENINNNITPRGNATNPHNTVIKLLQQLQTWIIEAIPRKKNKADPIASSITDSAQTQGHEPVPDIDFEL